VATLPNSFGPVNKIDTPAERDLALNSLRLAATKARLKVTLFETLHIALRQKQTDVRGVIQRLKDEGCYNEVPFLEAARGER
jgi:hypothetical protein